MPSGPHHRSRRRADMALRSKVMGFACAFGVGFSFISIAQVIQTNTGLLTEHEVLVFVIPILAFTFTMLMSIIGWFVRGAYVNIINRIDRLERTLLKMP